MVTRGTIITNRLRESDKKVSDIARELGINPSYVLQVIHGFNKSWKPGAMKIRLAIANQLHTSPDELWDRPAKTATKDIPSNEGVN